MSPPILRPYQVDALAAVGEAFASGLRSVLVVVATGLGKTVTFAALAREEARAGGRVLILAHRTELLAQAQDKLHRAGVASQLEQGGARAGDAPIVTASVQTLHGRRLLRWPAEHFTLVIIDEAHRATAASYRAIIDHFANARVLGVTATPDRGDGEALIGVFQRCVYRYDLRDAIRDKWLAPIRAKRITVDSVDIANVKTLGGDLEPAALALVMSNEAALHGVAKPLIAEAGDRQTIVFSASVDHAHRLAEVANHYRPGWARAIDGTTSPAVRKQLLDDFAGARFGALINCGLFTEGFDEPSVSCIAVARPTKSRALYTQMIGRGTRLADGKQDCLVLDFVGNSGRHRLIGPIDALAGRVVDDHERVAGAKVLAADSVQLDAVAEMEQMAQASANAAVSDAVVKYEAEYLDPFLPLPPRTRVANDIPATDRQRFVLKGLGVAVPAGLTAHDAMRWLHALRENASMGRPTFKQLQLLKRAGVPAAGISKTEATKMIAELISTWRRAS